MTADTLVALIILAVPVIAVSIVFGLRLVAWTWHGMDYLRGQRIEVADPAPITIPPPPAVVPATSKADVLTARIDTAAKALQYAVARGIDAGGLTAWKQATVGTNGDHYKLLTQRMAELAAQGGDFAPQPNRAEARYVVVNDRNGPVRIDLNSTAPAEPVDSELQYRPLEV